MRHKHSKIFFMTHITKQLLIAVLLTYIFERRLATGATELVSFHRKLTLETLQHYLSLVMGNATCTAETSGQWPISAQTGLANNGAQQTVCPG